MIGQRYAVAPRGAITARGQRESLWGKLGVTPAVAGREYLSRWLEQSTLIRLILAMTLVAVAGLLYMNQASKANVLELSIGDLQQQQIQLDMRNANLHAEASTLSGLQRIDTTATTDLRMTKPDLSTAIWIRPLVPRLSPLPNRDDGVAAQRTSEPIAAVKDFIQFLGAQL